MNDAGFIHWPFVLTAEEQDVSGEVDLEALDEHLDAAETALWKAADSMVHEYHRRDLWDAIDAIQHACGTATDSEYEVAASEILRHCQEMADFADGGGWATTIGTAIENIAALRADVKEAA